MKFSEFLRLVKSDLKTHKALNLYRSIQVYFFNPSFRTILNYRIGRYLNSSTSKYVRFCSNFYLNRQIRKRGCYISYRAQIGEQVIFAHPIAVVIGHGVIIENNVKIWQSVTLGSHGRKGTTSMYPHIHSNVRILTGATLIGGIEVGENAVIGAHAVVNIDVPANTKAVGIPAKIIS